jgi:hypothetical protein
MARLPMRLQLSHRRPTVRRTSCMQLLPLAALKASPKTPLPFCRRVHFNPLRLFLVEEGSVVTLRFPAVDHRIQRGKFGMDAVKPIRKSLP